jgi:hypothetical protein
LPLILSLAMSVQAAPQNLVLTADPAQAPLTCAAAYSQTSGDKPRIFTAAAVSYLLSKQIADTPSSKSFFARLQSMKTDGPTVPKDVTPEQARALAPQCDKRFPQARRDGPVKLPTDPLARDAACLFALSTMGGAAGSMPGTDPAVVSRYKDAANRFATSFDQRIGTSGIPADQQEAHAAKLVIQSFELGNAYIISDACLALPAS